MQGGVWARIRISNDAITPYAGSDLHKVFFIDGTVVDAGSSPVVTYSTTGGSYNANFVDIQNPNMPELASWGSLNPTWAFSYDDGEKFRNGNGLSGDAAKVSSGEWIQFDYKLYDTLTYADFEQRVVNPTSTDHLLVGLHVGDVGSTGASYALLSVPVPAPGAALLVVIGLGLVGWVKKRLA